jgi:hypothetical protein
VLREAPRAFFVPWGSLSASALSCAGGGGRSGKNPTPASIARQRDSPRWGECPRRCPLSCKAFLLDYSFYPLSVSVVKCLFGDSGVDRRSASRSVRRGRNDRRGRPPVREDTRPTSLACVQASSPSSLWRPQAGHICGAPLVRLLCRRETVRLPQTGKCAGQVLEYVTLTMLSSLLSGVLALVLAVLLARF